MKGSEIKESCSTGCSTRRKNPENRKKVYININPSLDPEIAFTPSKARHPELQVVASAHIVS
jgi:hypothetical protein